MIDCFCLGRESRSAIGCSSLIAGPSLLILIRRFHGAKKKKKKFPEKRDGDDTGDDGFHIRKLLPTNQADTLSFTDKQTFSYSHSNAQTCTQAYTCTHTLTPHTHTYSYANTPN